MAKSKSKYVTLGKLWAERNDKGEETGKVFITLDEGIKGINLEAEDYNGNDVSGSVEKVGKENKMYINSEDPYDRLERLLEGGFIEKKSYDKQIKGLEKVPHLIAELSVKVE